MRHKLSKQLLMTLSGLKKLELFCALLAQYGYMKDVEELINDAELILEWAFPNESEEQQQVH